MVHPVVNVIEEQAAAVFEGLDPGKEPYVLVFLLRPSAAAGPAGEGKPHEEAYEVYMRATACSMNAFVHKAKEHGREARSKLSKSFIGEVSRRFCVRW